MNQNTRFLSAVRPLYQKMGLEPPTDDRPEQPASCVFQVDEGVTVALLGHQEGYLIAVAEVDAAVDIDDSRRLLPLLAANRFTAQHPPLIGSVDPESGTLSLWARQALEELDDAGMASLFERLAGAATGVRAWLASPMDAPSAWPMDRLSA